MCSLRDASRGKVGNQIEPRSGGTGCTSWPETLLLPSTRSQTARQYAVDVIRRSDVLGPRLPRMKFSHRRPHRACRGLQRPRRHRFPLQRASRILFDLKQAAVPLRKPSASSVAMQSLTVQDFAYNSLACKYLRGNPPIPLKPSILQVGGRGP